MLVRPVRSTDHAAVHALHTAAFGPASGTDDVVEARLTDELRDDAGSP